MFLDLYYGGEALALEQPQAYTCPFCNRMGFTDSALIEHVTAEHADTTLAVSITLIMIALFTLYTNYIGGNINKKKVSTLLFKSKTSVTKT